MTAETTNDPHTVKPGDRANQRMGIGSYGVERSDATPGGGQGIVGESLRQAITARVDKFAADSLIVVIWIFDHRIFVHVEEAYSGPASEFWFPVESVGEIAIDQSLLLGSGGWFKKCLFGTNRL